MRRSWTIDEDQFIRHNYGSLPPADMAERLGRTKDQVVWRAGVLGVRTPRNPAWTDAENQFLRDNYPTMPDEEISARLGRSLVAINHQAGRLGIAKIGPSSDWTEDEDALLGDLYATMATGKLADLLGRSSCALVHRAMRLGIGGRPRRPDRQAKGRVREETVLTMRWDRIRHDYFAQIDSPMKAYVLGWLASDGNVKSDSNAVRLRINAKDEGVLHLVRAEIAPLHPITPYLGRRPSGETSSMVRFEVSSGQMKQDLIRLGVTPNKSLTIQYPQIPAEFDNSFILGCFDGDGSLGHYGRHPGQKRLPRWSLVSGSLPFLEEVQHRILSHAGIEVRGPHRKRRKGDDRAGVWIIAKSGRSVSALDAWLHADVPGLARKRLSPDEHARIAREVSVCLEKVERVRQMRVQGYAVNEIAAEVGVHRSSVHRWTRPGCAA